MVPALLKAYRLLQPLGLDVVLQECEPSIRSAVHKRDYLHRRVDHTAGWWQVLTQLAAHNDVPVLLLLALA